MPKVTKRKREKNSDFSVSLNPHSCAREADRQKAKLKLGKGKKVPSNATDTSFKARCAYGFGCAEKKD